MLRKAAQAALDAIEQGESFDHLDRVIAPALRAALEPSRQHITDGARCWCEPDLSYKDPVTGAEVWIHKEPQ